MNTIISTVVFFVLLLGTTVSFSAKFMHVCGGKIHRLPPRAVRLYSYPKSIQQDYYTLEAKSDPNINPLCRLTENQIWFLIERRLECKKGRKFQTADKILDALNKNGIYLQDKQRKYRVDGQTHFGRKKHYIQRGGTYGVDMGAVEKLIEERSRFKRIRDYYRSDGLTRILKEEYGVRVDDKRREWMVENGTEDINSSGTCDSTANSYTPTPLASMDHPTHTMKETIKNIIRERLDERSKSRKNKKCKEADRILSGLISEYSVVVDDRTKEWKIVLSDETPFEDLDDPFAREAKISQRSAFVQSNRRDIIGDVVTSAAETLLGLEEIETISTDIVTNETIDDLRSLTVVALREKLRMCGLPVSGKKLDLIDRLLTR